MNDTYGEFSSPQFFIEVRLHPLSQTPRCRGSISNFQVSLLAFPFFGRISYLMICCDVAITHSTTQEILIFFFLHISVAICIFLK